MPRRWVCLAWLTLAAAGCSSADDTGAGPGPGGVNPWVQGGQTGALTPLCGPSPAARIGNSVPGGDGGIVVYTESCGTGFDAADLVLRDPEGNSVPFTVEPLGDGALLLRPSGMLAEGVYVVDGAGGDTEVEIGRARVTPPMQLGTLVQDPDSCSADFDLTLAPEALEYLPQLRLSVRVDDGPLETWFDYGTLGVVDNRAHVSLPHCLSRCFSAAGRYRIEVVGEIAGELGTLEPIETSFGVDCPGASGAGATGCAVAGAPGHAPGGWPVIAAALLWLLRRKRRPPS